MADLNTLIENLKAEDYYSRASAARALGELGGKEAIAALIEALGDEDDWVKEYAAEALGKLAHGPAVGPIGQLLKSDNYKIRSSAVAALGKIGGDEAVKMLEPLRDDSDSWVREIAISTLDRLAATQGSTKLPKAPVITSEPIPATIESESEDVLSLSEAPAAPGRPAEAPTPRLADHKPRTPEEIVRQIAEDSSAKYKETRSGFLLRVAVGKDRTQRVRLKFDSVDEEGSPIIQILSIIGPASQKHYRWALKLNPTFSYGAIGLVKIDGKELLAAIDTFLEENVEIEALKKSVRTLAEKADELERKLIQKDLW